MRSKDKSKIEAIFKATLVLVKERGLAGITMNDISKAASIGTGTLYIYFKKKDELIRALFLECRQESARQYFTGLKPEAAFEERLRKVFVNIVTFKLAYFEVSAFLEQSCHSPFVRKSDIKKKELAMSPLFNLIKEGISNKKIKDAGVEMIVYFMFGIINEMVKKAYFSNKKPSLETIEELYAMFWDGIRR